MKKLLLLVLLTLSISRSSEGLPPKMRSHALEIGSIVGLMETMQSS